MTVQSGTATVHSSGNQVTITASQNAFLNWQSFNINPGEIARFYQPSAASIVWNRISDSNPSQIFGNLEANGVVVLMNQSGFFFGPNSSVSAAGLVVSTSPVAPTESSAGLFWRFDGAPPQASIINYGHFSIASGGPLFLIGQHIENHGTLSAPSGEVRLMAGKEVFMNERPDGRGLSATVRLPTGSVDNSGRILADAGTIALNAQVVNQNGQLQANSVRQRNGVIELIATDAVRLGDHSNLSAKGGEDGTSNGGTITIKASGSFGDSSGSRITVTGGPDGGNGGHVELSATRMPQIRSTIDGNARSGYSGGTLLIDPQDIVIGSSGTASIARGDIGVLDPPASGALNLDVNSSFIGFSQLSLQASRNITVADGTIWDLVASTGLSEPNSVLKLEAGNNISLGNGAGIIGGRNWSLTLQAGRDFTSPNLVRSGTGNILLTGTASLETQNGDIHLLAGNNVTVGGGFVRTMGGGNIDVEARAGSVNTGTRANGFNFRPNGYLVDADLGGISTANGGNVKISAGLDIISYLPAANGIQTDAGSGAFGAAPGDVALNAGRDVTGHFVVRNGDGSISAGRNAGTPARQLALSLVSGGWLVDAGDSVTLQEIRNPNGIFNNLGFGTSATRHLFDYSPDAFAILVAANGVQLTGSSLPRNDDNFERSIIPIYPGHLEITAGSGGISLGSDVTLFPSPIGALQLTTTGGGSLRSSRLGNLAQLVMSDSGKTQYRATGDFGLNDHASAPLHLNDSEPLKMNISGDVTEVLIGAPKHAEVTVGGNMIDSRFDGQNLRDSDVTTIHVHGDIINRTEFTSVSLSLAPDFTLFDRLLDPLPSLLANLPNQFNYDAAAKTLTFQGRMNNQQLETLLNLRVVVFDKFGQPLLDSHRNPVTQIVSFAPAKSLQQLFADSQNVPSNPSTGYLLGGGGKFDITAHNLELGSTRGIVSQGPRENPALAKYFERGADINVALSGNLEMFSTTISSINGGNISIVSDGSITVGSKSFLADNTVARGIFTSDRSDVTVIARQDINVNGSRIAAYDGGNVTVRSVEGSVDAGTGGLGSVPVEKIYVDSVTRAIRSYTPTIPGSGILATSFPPPLDSEFPASHNAVGDILVETPHGDIHTGSGGVVQIPLNGIGTGLGTVTLRAGARANDGTVLHLGNIDATGSGVIGSAVRLVATGQIEGVAVARTDLDINAGRNVNVVGLADRNATITSGGLISGSIIGIGSVNASGSAIEASLLSQNVSTSGSLASDQVGFTQGSAANATGQALPKDQSEKLISLANENEEEAETRKRRAAVAPGLARSVGRVTVVLPETKK